MNCEALESWLDERDIAYRPFDVTRGYAKYILTNTTVLDNDLLIKIAVCKGKVAVNPKGYLVIIDQRIDWE